jgi:hypothetical protein
MVNPSLLSFLFDADVLSCSFPLEFFFCWVCWDERIELFLFLDMLALLEFLDKFLILDLTAPWMWDVMELLR